MSSAWPPDMPSIRTRVAYDKVLTEIAQAAADAIMPDVAPVTINADHTGTVLSGQLPRNIAFVRYDGQGTDVTSSSAWSATTVSGGATYSIGASTGILNVTALTATTVIEVTSVYDNITRTRKLTITKALADPPASSSSGTEYDSSINSTASDSYGAANAGILTITAGASGEAELAAPLSITTGADGTYNAYGKWQVSASGAGVWTDVDTEILSSVAARANSSIGLFEEGYIAVNQTATGLTPSSDYDFQLLLRNSSGTNTLYYSGTASATTS